MGQIYKITITKPSGEIFNYIGKSSLTSEIRFKSHQSGDQLVDRYMKKYLDSTVLTTLVTGVQTEEELNDLESYYIQKFESYKPWGKNGLNLTLGGDGARKYEINKDELQGYIDAGLSDTEICVRLGNIANKTLENWIKSLGVKRKNQFERHEVTIRTMIEDGKSIVEISQATGIGSARLGLYLKSIGLKATVKSRSKHSEEDVLLVKSLTEEGNSARKIEILTGISRSVVNVIQRKLGLKTNLKGGGSRKSNTQLTEEFIDELVSLKKQGLNNSAISRELKCSLSTVKKVLGKVQH